MLRDSRPLSYGNGAGAGNPQATERRGAPLESKADAVDPRSCPPYT